MEDSEEVSTFSFCFFTSLTYLNDQRQDLVFRSCSHLGNTRRVLWYVLLTSVSCRPRFEHAIRWTILPNRSYHRRIPIKSRMSLFLGRSFFVVTPSTLLIVSVSL